MSKNDARASRGSQRRGRSTRAGITATASQLLRRQGYAATGLNQVVAESGAPKGSLYHYFPNGKEQLACEAIQRSKRKVSETIDAAFERASDLAEVLEAIAAVLARNLERSSFQDGCPVGTVCLEAAAQSDAIHEACSQTFTTWQADLVGWLRRHRLDGEQAASHATLILCAFEGALMMARAQRDVRPLYDVAAALAAGLSS